jgi:hypothetical protein
MACVLPSRSFRLLVPLAFAAVRVLAQSGSDPDEFSFFAVAQPEGPAAASYLRLRHPLHLLDLCRQVKAGALDRREVEPLVGGAAVLEELLRRDLDSLYDALTAPQDLNSPPAASLWFQVLTHGGAAPPPPPELPDVVAFNDVRPLDVPSEVIRITAPADGTVEVSLPADSPFRILSMRSYDGLILQLPRTRGAPGYARVKTESSLRLQFARDQTPWEVPVQAGQDVDVEIGLPAGTALPPEGFESTVTFGDGSGSWSKNVSLTAKPAPSLDALYVFADFQKTAFAVVKPPSYVPGYKQPFLVPLTLANPYPPATVKGTVKLLSGPPGLSMPTHNFNLGPNGSIQLFLTLYIESGTPAWSAEYALQPFRLQISYHTVPLFAAGTTKPNYGAFVIYPGSKHWSAKGNAGPIDCNQDLALYSTGTLFFSSTCGNYNIFPGKAQVFISLGATQVGAVAFYLSPYQREFTNWSVSSPTYQTQFTFWQAQPMVVTWKGCTLC